MNVIEEMKNRVSMRELLESYGIYPHRGRNIYRCLAHNPDKNPSAGITKDGLKFKCFACGFIGDILDVVMLMDKCDLKTATKIIDDRFRLGLLHELSYKEKLELARQRKERERAKAEKLWWEQYEKSVRNNIVKQLRMWEEIQTATHITRGEYKRGEWEFADLFFTALKRQDWLNWLYNAICGVDHPECEFDYTHPFSKRELLEKIRKGEIEVW